MSMLDANFNFSAKQALTGTANSTNTYDAGSAKKVFGGTNNRAKLGIQITGGIGGTSPTFRAQFVGADNAGLTANPETIADTGVSPVLAAADAPVLYELIPGNQKVAKQHYGMIYTLGGTSPTMDVNAQLSESVQNNLAK